MNEATIGQLVVSGSLFFILLGLFIWGYKSGQFKHVEEGKYIVLKKPGETPSEKPREDKPGKGGDGK